MDWSYSRSKKKPIRTELIKTADGKIAFCLNVDLKSPSGQDLPEMGKVDINVYRVLLNGYPQKSPQELGYLIGERRITQRNWQCGMR